MLVAVPVLLPSYNLYDHHFGITDDRKLKCTKVEWPLVAWCHIEIHGTQFIQKSLEGDRHMNGHKTHRHDDKTHLSL